MTQRLTLTIIGPGKVGSTLAYRAYQSQRYHVAIGSRDTTKAKVLARNIGKEVTVVDTQMAASMGDIVLLTVPDTAIHPVCNELAQAHSFKEEAIVAHCSGALSSNELIPAQDYCSSHIASMHPLQTFPSFNAAVDNLIGSYCYYEGDNKAKPKLRQLIEDIGMQPIEIQKQAKALYHASAVIACNYLSTLMDSALEIGEAAGIDRETLWQSLEPLVNATLSNIKSEGTQGALTGPIVRGDISTIQEHQRALMKLPPQQAERLNKVYSAMGIQTAYLANQKGAITKVTEKKLKEEILSFTDNPINTEVDS